MIILFKIKTKSFSSKATLLCKFVVMKQTLGKQERLKSKTLIGKLYKEGNSVKSFPLRLVYVQTEHTSQYPAQVGVSLNNLFKRFLSTAFLKFLFGTETPTCLQHYR